MDYERQTIDSPNPMARFAHRRRLAIASKVVRGFEKGARILDYGCGQGRFLNEIAYESRFTYRLMGWDPFADMKYDGFEVVSDRSHIESDSLDLITCLEVCEHLDALEFQEFMAFSQSRLKQSGRLLVTVPIMVGPALMLKQFNSSLLHRRRPEYSLREMLAASIWGAHITRAGDIKSSHKGYDFRETIELLRDAFILDRIRYSPLPIRTWYGNSQAIVFARKR